MGALPLVGGPGERGAGRVALGHPTGGVAGSVCAEGACPREALAGRGGRTLQVGPRRARGDAGCGSRLLEARLTSGPAVSVGARVAGWWTRTWGGVQ